MNITLFTLAQRYIGIAELNKGDHPLIQWWHSLCDLGLDAADEIPWCSSFVNGMCWELRLPRSKSARARSWLNVGTVINHEDAEVGFCVVVLKRGDGQQPGAEVIDAPGHVGIFAGWSPNRGQIYLLGGNQGDQVCVRSFAFEDILGFRLLHEDV